MSDTTDTEALTAWADALRNGLGRVRFGDLPDAEFERILETVPADDVDTLVVFAENASLSGLESIESSGPQVPRVRQAIASRRAHLSTSPGQRVVNFPGSPARPERASRPEPERRAGWFQWLLNAFREEPTSLDDFEGRDFVADSDAVVGVRDETTY